jgi:hypothetical protein
MLRAIDRAVHQRILISEAKGKEQFRFDFDTQLLTGFAPGAVVEVFPSRNDSANGQIPIRWINIFRRGALVNKKSTAAIEDEKVGGAMGQALGAHFSPRHLTDDAAIIINNINQLESGVTGHRLMVDKGKIGAC